MNARIAVVTGAGSGIGAATARLLAQQGHHAVIADRDLAAAQCVADGFVAEGLTAQAKHVDIGDLESIAGLFASVEKEHQRCDILVNNAGISQIGT